MSIRLTNNSALSGYPSIAVSGSNIHIVWEDFRDGIFQIYYKRSTDNGETWGPDVRLTNTDAFSRHPSIAVKDSFVHIVWADERDGNPEIYYKRSTDNGETWSSDTRLTNHPVQSEYPFIAVFGTNIHVVWRDGMDGNPEIYYKRSLDNGITWENYVRISNALLPSEFPCVAVQEQNIHIVWEDYREGNWEIYYKRSTDNGESWEPAVRLTFDLGVSSYPSLVVSDSNIHVVWSDNRDGNDEIYYKRSTNNGVSWELDFRLTSSQGSSSYPSIAVWGPNIHVVWSDDRDGNEEVYYKHNPTGNVGIFESSPLKKVVKIFTTSTIFKNRISLKLKRNLEIPIKISLYNLYGSCLYENFHTLLLNHIDIEGERINRLSSGIYFLYIFQGKKNVEKIKIMKIK